MTDSAAAPAPKLDPETLALRAHPPRAIRFRRGLIVGGAAIGSCALTAIAWFALKPVTFERVAERTELSEPASRPGDALERAPASYAQVPKLGPALPGDLGRPILAHQRAMAAEAASPSNPAGPAAQQAEAAERQRREDALRAARESPLLVEQRGPAGPAEPVQPVADSGAAAPPAAAAAAGGDANPQQRKLESVAALDPRGDVNPHRLAAAPSPYLLSAGSVISASLITGLRSDLPGLVTAQVTEPVFDSATGAILLIPQGARLIGSYDSVVAFGQRRALIVWQRILFPDGASLRLDNAPAADASGYAGLADKVDFHSWSLLKGIVLSTLLGVGSELALKGDGDLVEAVRRSTQDTVSRAGDRITERNLTIQPTITIRPGARVRLVVHKDLILAPWRAS
jgi:type IV secretion system protein VirB10